MADKTEAIYHTPTSSFNNDSNSEKLCRICYGFESEITGNEVLEILKIKVPRKATEDSIGEADIEMGSNNVNPLIRLGCSCKNDLSLVHYSCALKWFRLNVSLLCEICGSFAKTIRCSDLTKVHCALLRCHDLNLMAAQGDPDPPSPSTQPHEDPNAITHENLKIVSHYFNPQVTPDRRAVVFSEAESERPVIQEQQQSAIPERQTAGEYGVDEEEGCVYGNIVGLGTLTTVLAWDVAPVVEKKLASIVLYFLCAGTFLMALCLLLQFVLYSRIKHRPSCLCVFLLIIWFLFFAVWALRTNVWGGVFRM